MAHECSAIRIHLGCLHGAAEEINYFRTVVYCLIGQTDKDLELDPFNLALISHKPLPFLLLTTSYAIIDPDRWAKTAIVHASSIDVNIPSVDEFARQQLPELHFV